MFEKLVVSTTDKRKHRRARFFVVTAIVYAGVVGAALALSVVLSSPRLADTGSVPPPIAVFSSSGGPPDRGHHPTESTHPPKPDPNNVMDLGTLMHQAEVRPQPPLIPHTNWATEDFGYVGPPSGGTGAFGALPGSGRGIGDGQGEEIAPVPRPTPVSTTKPQPEPDKKLLRVPSVVLQGKAIQRFSPDYPPLARQIRLEGSVSVEVVVSPQGIVESARALSGHALLLSCSVDAARRWRFEPTLLNNIPVRVTGVITFVFKLAQ